jgi:hypothetical protein
LAQVSLKLGIGFRNYLNWKFVVIEKGLSNFLKKNLGEPNPKWARRTD